MTLSAKLDVEFKEALKAGNGRKVSVLRMVKAAIKNKEIEKGSPLIDDEIYSILSSFVKRGRESIEQFSRAGREELVNKEKEELEIIRSYLPQQLSEEEVKSIVKAAIDEVGAKEPRDMGKVMKTVMPKVSGRIDGKVVNDLVRKMLEG